MARDTKAAIELLLGDTGFITTLEAFVAEYMVGVHNELVSMFDAETLKISGAISGISGVGTTGYMLQPADPEKVPTKRNDNTALQQNDWYINTKTASIDFYNKKDDDWYTISLSPLFDAALIAWKANVGDNSYVDKDNFMELADIIKETLTTAETNEIATQWIDGLTVRALYAENFNAQLRNLVDATDELTFTAVDRMEYRDIKNDLRTGYPEIVKIGNKITYTTVLHPYERLHQIGSSFTGTFVKSGMSVNYSLSGSSYGTGNQAIALQFIDKGGANRDKYTLTSIIKAEADKFVHYVRISGTATLQLREAVLPGQTSNVIENIDLATDPRDFKASDLFPNDNDNAIVIFDFTTAPSLGDKVLDLEFLAPAQFIVNRYVEEMKKIQANIGISAKDTDDKIKEIQNQYPTWNFGGFTDAFGSAMYNYSKFPQIISMVGKKAPLTGDRFLWEVPYDANLSGKGTIMLTPDGANMEVLYPEVRANSDINDPSNVGKPVIGKSIADLVDANWLILEKKLDDNGKTYWLWVGLKRKPADPRGMKIVSKQVNTWDELVALKDNIVSVSAFAKAQIDWYGAAFRQSNIIPFLPLFSQGWGLQGAADLSNNLEYKFTIDSAAGVQVWNGTSSVGGSDKIAFDKFNWYVQVMEGSAYTTTDTMLESLAKGKPDGEFVIKITGGAPTLVPKT